MRTLALIFGLLLFFSGLQGQIVYDTVQVTVEGDISYTTILVPDTTISIGDSIQFSAEAFDSEGDPVNAMFTWVSRDSTIVQINSTTGLALALSKGNVEIIVRAERIGELFLASFRPPDSLNWTGIDSIAKGETLQYCAYLVDPYNKLLGEDPGPPTCPTVYLPRTEPSFSLFALIPRTRCLMFPCSSQGKVGG